MSDKNNEKNTPKETKGLKKFEIKVNKFGQLEKNISNDDINTFLNKNLLDKKLNPNEIENKEAEKEDNEPK
jgi:hypothetical protein